MGRLIPIMNAKKLDAQVSAELPRRPPAARLVAPTGTPVGMTRVIRGTDQTTHEALLRQFGDAEGLAKALVDGDPEIPRELVGRALGDATRVYVRPDGSVLTAARLVQVVRGPDGAEKSRAEFVDVEANVGDGTPPLVWTGRLIPIDEALRKFVFTRALQLQHVNGLTYEFLYDIAKTLAGERKLLLLGTGPKGAQPLIFTTNGAPYRGFLEGRVAPDDGGYRLVLHLSNLELKAPPPKEAKEPVTQGGAS